MRKISNTLILLKQQMQRFLAVIVLKVSATTLSSNLIHSKKICIRILAT